MSLFINLQHYNLKIPVEQFKLKEGESFIELNNLLKALSWVATGGEAKTYIDQGVVLVNGQIEKRRRNKLKPGDKIEFDGESAIIID
jgi:ribosome-associated protein